MENKLRHQYRLLQKLALDGLLHGLIETLDRAEVQGLALIKGNALRSDLWVNLIELAIEFGRFRLVGVRPVDALIECREERLDDRAMLRQVIGLHNDNTAGDVGL